MAPDYYAMLSEARRRCEEAQWKLGGMVDIRPRCLVHDQPRNEFSICSMCERGREESR